MFILTPEMVLAAGWQDMSLLNPDVEYRMPTFGLGTYAASENTVYGIKEGYSARFFLTLRNECYTEIWMMPVFTDVYYGVIYDEDEFKSITTKLKLQ